MNDMYAIWGMNLDDLRDEILGHTVVKVDTDVQTITLDNGTELIFEDVEDCCSWFEAELTAGNLVDNAITDVTCTDNADEDDWQEDYTIHILAANKKVADLNITGSEGSGYYCHGINLNVVKVQND